MENLKMKRVNLLNALLLSFALAASTGVVRADDGGISFGGSPKLLKGHASVAMKDEVVTMDIHDELIKVDCKFTFHNAGDASTVRVGFPDEGQGAEEPYQGDDHRPTGKNLKATFLSYESWVDGKKVPTELVPTNDRTLYWHAKTVNFKAKSDCLIRDLYTLPPGGQVTNENGLYKQTSYVLHTGASWHGPIGRAEIIVNFDPKVLKGPIQLKALSSLPGKSVYNLKWSTMPPGTVIYDGPCEPKVEGNTLRFACTNLRPAKKDDVRLYYGYRALTNNL